MRRRKLLHTRRAYCTPRRFAGGWLVVYEGVWGTKIGGKENGNEIRS